MKATEQLTATIAPANADNKNITWSSSSTAVATVSSTGLVAAVSEGTATIIAITEDGGKMAYCAVTVIRQSTYTYTVSFVSNGNTLFQQMVAEGDRAQKPVDPLQQGYTFSGWFSNGTEWDFGTPVMSDLMLEAKWKFNDESTSVANQLQAAVKLYPNPFADELQLTGAEGCLLQVVNAVGATVHTQKITGTAQTISLKQLPAGMYFFRLEKEGKTKAIRVVKH
jgi:hypothetical protein